MELFKDLFNVYLYLFTAFPDFFNAFTIAIWHLFN